MEPPRVKSINNISTKLITEKLCHKIELIFYLSLREKWNCSLCNRPCDSYSTKILNKTPSEVE
jgi:hypothetical protein